MIVVSSWFTKVGRNRLSLPFYANFWFSDAKLHHFSKNFVIM